jgi:hypothetical protein
LALEVCNQGQRDGAAAHFVGSELLGLQQRRDGLVPPAFQRMPAGNVDKEARPSLPRQLSKSVWLHTARHLYGSPAVTEVNQGCDLMQYHIGGAKGCPAVVAVFPHAGSYDLTLAVQLTRNGRLALPGSDHAAE